jgi:imidazolonepropionase-like amidohydrolase
MSLKNPSRRWLVALAVVLAGGFATAQRQTVPPQERVAFVNASVVNVRSGAIQPGATVVVASGKIESIGSGAAPAGARLVDLRGRHLLPGLIDAHVHIASLPQMRNALETGVTTARSAGVSNYADVGLRELVRKGFVAGPDMLAAGYHVRPGPAPELFMTDPDLGDLMGGGFTTADALRRLVRANLAHGADWIKVLATERAGTADTDPRKQVYSEVELRAIVQEAGAKGIPVLAHAHGAEGALAAVKAGVRSIEHGTYLTDEALQLMATQGTFFDPTSDIVNDLSEPGGDYDNAALQRRGQMMKPILESAVKRAKTLGVKIVAGSDTGYGPQSVTTLAREVIMLTSFGLSPIEALQAATTRNAELLKIESRVGVIEPGLEADLLVVDGNPLQNVRALLDPVMVMSNGRIALDRLTFGK